MAQHQLILQRFLGLWLVLGFSGMLSAQLIPNDIGAAIYQQGYSDTKVDVLIGSDEIAAPLKLFACKNCHGETGKGKQEAGMTAPDIRWSQLQKPYKFTSVEGRQRAPYNRDLLARAITKGIDPSGNPLNHNMPRYQLSQTALAALLDYMAHSEQIYSNGVGDDFINIHILLPDAGSLKGQALSTILKPLMQAYFDRVNQQNGIYNRRLQLHYSYRHPQANEHAQPTAQSDIFALLDLSFQATNLSSSPIMTIAAYGEGSETNPHHYTLYPTPDRTKEILLGYIQRHLGLSEKQIVALSHDVHETCLTNHNALAVFMSPSVKPDCLLQWLSQWREQDAAPILLLGHASSQDRLLKQYPAPVYTIVPLSMRDVSLRGRRAYQQLIEVYSLSQQQIVAQLMALASAETLISALQQSGRELSLNKLQETLDGFYEFDTGFGPPITFGPNRRLGIQAGMIRQLNTMDGQVRWAVPFDATTIH